VLSSAPGRTREPLDSAPVVRVVRARLRPLRRGRLARRAGVGFGGAGGPDQCGERGGTGFGETGEERFQVESGIPHIVEAAYVVEGDTPGNGCYRGRRRALRDSFARLCRMLRDLLEIYS
jgi:hypothetical protein